MITTEYEGALPDESGPPVPENRWPKYVQQCRQQFVAYGEAVCDALAAENTQLAWVDEAADPYFVLAVDGVAYARLHGFRQLPKKVDEFVKMVEVCHRDQFASADLAAARAAVDVG